MSRRHKDRPAQLPASVQQVAGAPLTPIASEVHEKAISADALKQSVTTQPPAEPNRSWGESLTLLLAHEADDIPPWGTNWALRDEKLRELWPTEPTIAGALATLAMRNACMEVHFEGPSRTVDAVQRMWHEADNGNGAGSWFAKLSLDLYSQDNGAFPEWIRADYVSAEEAMKRIASGKPLPPVVGLGYLDSRWCTRTGNPLYPVVYEDPDDPKHERHLLPWHVVSPMAELPSPAKLARGRQYCALTRILHAAQYMRDLNIYRREKVTGRNASEIQFVGGPSNSAINDAIEQMQERAANRSYLRYMPPVIVASLDPTKPVSTATLGLASLPEGFDYDAELRNYITVLAMCLGEDYLTFAPLPGGNQGTAAQSQVLERKTRGKGPALWQKIVTHMLNFNGVLPRTVEASFEERDIEAERADAEVAGLWVKVMSDAIASGIMTPQVAQQWLADNQIVLDDDYLALLGEQDATEDVTVSDDDQQSTQDMQPIDVQAPPEQAPAQPAPAAPAQPQQAARGGGAGFFRKALGWFRAWFAGRKAIGSTVDTFDAKATGAVDAYMSKKATRSKASAAFYDAISQAWGIAAIQGYTDGGGDEADLEDADYTAIEEEIANQTQYAEGMWDDLPEVRKDDGDPFPRVDMYTSSLRAWYTDWKLRGAESTPLTWEYGDTEHCDTCQRLNGQRHKASWYRDNGYIPRQPGSETLDCHGFNCQCRLIDKNGKEFTL